MEKLWRFQVSQHEQHSYAFHFIVVADLEGRKKYIICDYLEEMQNTPKPAVTDGVKCDTGGLCYT